MVSRFVVPMSGVIKMFVAKLKWINSGIEVEQVSMRDHAE